MKLTKRVVDAALPETGEFLWDDEVKGFGLRVRPTSKTYYVQYKHDGATRRVKIGRHGPLLPEEARIEAKKILGAVARGQDPAQERNDKRKDLTVEEVCSRYLEHGASTLKASTREAVERAVRRHIVPLIGRKKLNALTGGDIERMMSAIGKGETATDERTGHRGRSIVKGGQGAAARTVAYLRSILAYAVRDKLRSDNPAAGIRLKPSRPMERFLSPAEIGRLGEALVEAEMKGERVEVTNAIRLLLLTGARKQEVLQLRWNEVDLDGGYLRLGDSKTGRKVIAIGAPARQLLAEMPRKGDYVFPAAKGNGPLVGLQKPWNAIRTAARLGDVRVHDLRHSHASTAVAAGESLFLTGKLLGHARPETTARYAHLADDPLRAAADRVAGRIADQLGQRVDTTADIVPIRRA
ncbi:MAG TPA: site-specific integrase [Geminicoccus sp.]|nr:site-specific integrase [Geminicoccus sp.]